MPAVRPELAPDYHGGSILNLVTTLSGHFGVLSAHAEFDTPLPLAGVETIILLVVDGLGLEQLQKAVHQGVTPNVARLIGEHGLSSATSVFPSTTMAALTTLHTGCAPAEHGYLGLSVWLEELGQAVNLIRMHDVADRQPVTGASFLAAVPSIYQQISGLGVPCAVVMPEEYEQSFLTRWCCAGASYVGYPFQSTAASLTAQLVRNEEARYVMVYLPDYDSTCHTFGPSSEQAADELAAIDLTVGRLLDALPDNGRTLLVVTADHGQVDQSVQGVIPVVQSEQFRELLLSPMAGEERAAYFRVDPQRMQEATDLLAPYAAVFEADEAWEAGLFGPGADSPFRSRTGNLIAVANQGLALARRRSGTSQRGLHGGWSEAEMRVPVLAIRR
ncbi:alkaline phosphatase family protein [Deinococcus deserti]|uniref:Putative Type I phosphodiesterase / nucleotide pyrophosphatase n=1 Tax=Deinococcus deserti (strain DSM 17065 / CIP 109153 / LMG 22923 / VCD115) TaxID=546414 RepID=C1CWM0_DEIDV|nr:alkaline phosphatase family protein [Deinococcus deserti]ACO46587.1 putative Type I phosphodiesterase / nucleotide pyrophosphatase [Deinococcus deserti VCD115]